MSLSAQDRARRIKIILFDVDGVLTDGGIWLFPAPAPSSPATEAHIAEHAGKGGYAIASTSMVEAKGFNAHDGTAISLARLGGLKCGIITKRISETVALRARDLRLEFVYQGQAFKMKAVREIMEKEGVTLDEIAYVGDDVIDLPAMRECGFAVAVDDARERVKAEAHYVTPNRGGHGAARDAVEFILEAKGVLDQCIEAYIDERNPISPAMDIGKGGEDWPSRQCLEDGESRGSSQSGDRLSQAMETDRKRAVVLLSGGLDSATVLAIARSQGFALYALSFSYGQRHVVELGAARRVAASIGVESHKIAEIDLKVFGGSALTGDIDVPKGRTADEMAEGIPITYVPARNTIFLAFALAWAEVLGSNDIFIGVNALDYSGYPDCRPEYIAAFEKMANLATKAGVEGRQNLTIHTPLIAMTKAEIIAKGIELGVDYGLTSSCYDPSPAGAPCGECDSCLLRRKGFRENGIEDPLRYQKASF